MFLKQYANYYDIIYKKKGYIKESNYLQNIFKQHLDYDPKTILDLGCGTGNYMIPLLRRGYYVTGLDASESMLTVANKKLCSIGLSADLFERKLQSFDIKKKFDVVICMFSVIDYVTKTNDLKKTFANVVKHMKKKSIFVFDFWQDTAVENYYTPQKKKVYRVGKRVLTRESKTKILSKKNICEVSYACTLKESSKILAKDKEKHIVRYFSIEEMIGFLKKAGLWAVDIHPFMNLNGKIKKNTWDITIVAKKL